jgi:hypothetical protein
MLLDAPSVKVLRVQGKIPLHVWNATLIISLSLTMVQLTAQLIVLQKEEVQLRIIPYRNVKVYI